MRTADNLASIMLASKTADVRLTFRRRKLSFTSQTITDSEGIVDPSDLDVSAYNYGALRVYANRSSPEAIGVIHTQAISDLVNPSAYPAWVDRGIWVKPYSRPGVEGQRIWYQKTNGNICYRDYTSIATEHNVTSSLSPYILAFAPVGSDCYVYGLPGPTMIKSSTEARATYGSIWFVSAAGTVTSWNGKIYGDLTTPRYFDAVTLGGIDYVYAMDRAAGRVIEITRQGAVWSYGRYVVPIDAIDNITGVTLRYAAVIKSQVFLFCRVVNSSDDNVPVSMDVVIFGPAVYNAGILDSRNQQHYSFSRWSYITMENVGGKFICPAGSGKVYYLGANKLYTAQATILVGDDPVSLKHVSSDFFSLSLTEQENSGAQLALQMAHDFDTTQALDEVTFEFGYNTQYVQMGTYTILNSEKAGAFGQKQFNLIGLTSSFSDISMFTPHQSYYIASQDKVNSDPGEMMDVVVARGLFGKIMPFSGNPHEFSKGSSMASGHSLYVILG